MENHQNKRKKMKVEMEAQYSNKKNKINEEITADQDSKSTVSTISIQSSISSSHSSRNNDLYICLSTPVDKSYNVLWYKINPSYSTTLNDDEIPGITSVCSIPLEKVGYGFGVTSLGSKLYMIGGAHSQGSAMGSKDMYCIDTTDHHDYEEILVPRKLHADTLANRQGSAVVSTQGKIYVFGSNWTKLKPWAEVFDPSMDHWFPLPQPPNELLTGSGSLYSVVVGDKIILSYEKILLSFDVKTNSWERLYIPLRVSPTCLSGTIVDDVLFMYSACSVVAYDVLADKWFNEPVRGLELGSMSFLDSAALYEGQVVHLGDKNLCAIWLDEFEEDDFEHCIRCVKFRVSRIYDTEKEEEVLQAEVQARSAYRTLSGGGHFVDCFPM